MDQDTPTNILAETRKHRGLSLDEVSEKLKIRRKYIEALETHQWDEIPSPVYIKGYLKNYSDFLELDTDHLIAQYEQATMDQYKPASSTIETELEPVANTSQKKKPYLLIFFMILLLLLTYGLWKKIEFKRTTSLPAIEKESPEITPPNSAPTQPSTNPAASLKNISSKIDGFAPESHKVVLLSNESNRLQFYTSNKVFLLERKVQKGSTYFVPYSENLIIQADNPEQVEVFVDGENYTFIGTLQDLYIPEPW